MKSYVCSICGFIYDAAAGVPEKGIAPGTRWEDLSQGWVCPLCGATKADFKEKQTVNTTDTQMPRIEENDLHELRELSPAELSALCSNLSKGCEKQYQPEEADLFNKLSDYYTGKVECIDKKKFKDLLDLIQMDLDTYAQAKILAADQADRGALRALVWGEKVTNMLASLLNRYEKQQDTLLENTKVYVCEICGFVYVGDDLPDVCPVCKVPNMKLRQVERG